MQRTIYQHGDGDLPPFCRANLIAAKSVNLEKDGHQQVDGTGIHTPDMTRGAAVLG